MSRITVSIGKVTWEQLPDSRGLSNGDVVVFTSDEENVRGYLGEDKTYHWRVTNASEDCGNVDRVELENVAGGQMSGVEKGSRCFRLVVAKRKTRIISDVEKLWKLLERVTPAADRLLLYGPPGTGKTRLAATAGLRRGQQVRNVYLTEETPSAELRGHYIPTGEGRWTWQHGPGVLGWLGGDRFVANEINNASGDTLDFLLALLDDQELAGITLPNGEYVKPEGGFQCIATMNGEPDDLPPALQDRFVMRAKLMEPHPDALKRLPVDIRGAVTQRIGGADLRFNSVRCWLAFDKLRQSGTVTEAEAAQLVFEGAASNVLDALVLLRGGKVYAAPGASKPVAKRTSSKKMVTGTMKNPAEA